MHSHSPHGSVRWPALDLVAQQGTSFVLHETGVLVCGSCLGWWVASGDVDHCAAVSAIDPVRALTRAYASKSG